MDDEQSVTLTFRFGESVTDPTLADMRRALEEVLNEETLDLSEGDLAEHPNAWLSRGYANGEKWSVVTVDMYRTGLAVLSKYDDQDDDDPQYEHILRGIGLEACLELWQTLDSGNESALLRRFSDG